jgi:hypothetical protein
MGAIHPSAEQREVLEFTIGVIAHDEKKESPWSGRGNRVVLLEKCPDWIIWG